MIELVALAGLVLVFAGGLVLIEGYRRTRYTERMARAWLERVRQGDFTTARALEVAAAEHGVDVRQAVADDKGKGNPAS